MSNFVGFFETNFLENMADFMGNLCVFSGQISLEINQFYTDLTNIFNFLKEDGNFAILFRKMMSLCNNNSNRTLTTFKVVL